MSHRVAIFKAVSEALADPEVQETLTQDQRVKVEAITTAGAGCCSDEDFRYLSRRLNHSFCNED